MRVDVVVGSFGLGGIQTLLAEARSRFEADVRLIALQAAQDAVLLPGEDTLVLAGQDVPAQVRSLRGAWRSDAPAIVHSMNFHPGVVARLAARGTDVAAIHHDHGDAWDMGWHQLIADRALAGRSRRLIAISHASARIWAKRERLAPARLDVVPNGVALPERVPRRVTGEAILALGRLVPSKGFASLLEAFALLRGRRPGATLRIVGDGPHRPVLESLAARLGLDPRQVLPGFVRDVDAAYRAADCVVMPSVYEPFGRVLLEAAAHEVPLVVPRSCAVPEVLREDEAWLLDPTGPPLPRLRSFLMPPRRIPVGRDGPWIPARQLDPVALAAAIERVLDDRPEARRRAGRARSRVEADFGIGRFARDLDRLWQVA